MTAATPATTRPVLTFEEEPHIYRVDGRVVPSDTQVLKAVYGDLCWPWASEFAMERGRLVHHALHLWIIGDLDPKRLSDYIAGYVASGIRFLEESGFEIATIDGKKATEVRMYSEIYDFAGTADLFGTLNRRRCNADWKTGEPGWVAGPQTWGYTALWQEMTGEVIRDRYAVQLDADGGLPKVIPYKDHKNDQADFLAALRVMQRRQILGEQVADQGEEFL